MKSLIIVTLFLCFVSSISQSQTISNVVTKQDGNKVVITYNLQCDFVADISLYVSENGDGTFTGPLKSVTGDVGNNITPGAKTITWNTLQDQDMILGDNILFRIMGKSIFSRYTDNRDGKTYKTILIGNQTWMTENLSFKTGSGCWAYDNNETNVAKYGFLYDLKMALNVCPTGWHLPTDAEWTTLTTFLGGESIAGGKLKETGTNHWLSPNTGANNESGFTALPGGGRGGAGDYEYVGTSGYWWSSSKDSLTFAWGRAMSCRGTSVFRYYFGKRGGFSVRCLRD
jgi:uncharacterized protein (TIGR02145 family)